MEVLVTGGAGYIGSTVCSALEDGGHLPIILDSFITGSRDFIQGRPIYEGDIADLEILKNIRFKFPNCRSIIHCAARIVVGESVSNPFMYYTENVSKSIVFLKNAADLGFTNILFSSSAAVYGVTKDPGVTEEFSSEPMSPYAHTKYMMEKILESYCSAYKLSAISLRYFNPIGADPKLRSGMIKKDPSHILGRLLDTMEGRYPFFEIFGDDWPTRDGSAIRDYIHVWDLAHAHVKALEYLFNGASPSTHEIFNIGTGRGTTVKEFCQAFQKVAGRALEIRVSGRREGDVVGAYAVVKKANMEFGWSAKISIEEGIRDSIRWLNCRAARQV